MSDLFGGSSPPQGAAYDAEAIAAQSAMAAAQAREQSMLAHSQALEMEATRNAYALQIAERETQNEAELSAQQEAMESMLSDVVTGMDEQEEDAMRVPEFFASFLQGMGNYAPGTHPTGGPITAAGKNINTAEIGETIYGSTARPV